MIYGYARISTAKQSIERQIRNIGAAYPNAKIITEVYTGTTTARPQWDKLIKKLRKGDTLVFDSVSRMSRNAAEGVETYFDLYANGIELVFLKEGYINTELYKSSISTTIQATGNDIADIYIDATNKVIKLIAEKQIIKAFEQAEKEVEDLHQRTKEGMLTAKLNGKQIGARPGVKLTTKKSVECKELIRKHSKTFGGTLSDDEVITLCGCSRNSYYKYKSELKEGAAV